MEYYNRQWKAELQSMMRAIVQKKAKYAVNVSAAVPWVSCSEDSVDNLGSDDG